MKESTKDRAEGKYHEVKGKVKEATGKAFDNPRVAIEGQDEKISKTAATKKPLRKGRLFSFQLVR